MVGEEAAEGSHARRCMDLNLYVGLPPLLPPRVRLDTSVASSALMPNSTGAALEAPRMGRHEESLASAVAAHSPSIVLSTPEEHPTLDPIVYSWLDGSNANGEEYTDALESPPMPTLVEGPNVSGSQPLVATTGLEGYDLLVERSVRPSRVATAAGRIMEMVNTSTLVQTTQGTAPTTIEAGAPELRILRAIEIHQQHNIIRLGSTNPNQEATSADADRLARAIQHTQSSFEAARGQNLEGGNNSSFECNICFELARQPVVTSCGHLFCWSCLYQWLDAQPTISECPVCKGEVLKGDITPIYGRGGEEGESTNPDLPPRPQAHRRESLRQQLQMAQTAGNAREMARVLRQMIQNQNQGWDVRSLPTPIVSEAGPSRRSRRPSESPTTRRTRRRPQ